MRYGAAAGGAEEAHSRQPHWCPWSKPVNVETWGHVSGPIVMAHALAELRYGIEISGTPARKRFQIWALFGPYPVQVERQEAREGIYFKVVFSGSRV